MFTIVNNNLSPTGERSGPYEIDPDTLKQIKLAYLERDSFMSQNIVHVLFVTDILQIMFTIAFTVIIPDFLRAKEC